MIQTIRDWLQQPVLLSQTLPYVVIAILLVVVTLALAQATRRAATPRPTDTEGRARPRPQGALARWFGVMRLGPLEGVVVGAVFLAFMALFVMALVTAFLAVGDAVRNGLGDRPAGYAFSIGALLVALLGAPFLVWRTLVAQRTLEATQRQTDLQDEALFNDKINAAATDLAARRQVTRVVEQEGKEVILTEWQDDRVTRAAAIDRLQGLAEESRDKGDIDTVRRIARMLSIYVQELTREHPAQEPPKVASPRELRKWARDLPARKRSDMDRAVQALGRINPADDATRTLFDPKTIDLRGCNLQGLALTGLNFKGVFLAQAQIQGADLSGAQMQEADLFEAQMQGARLGWTQMQGARLSWAQMQGANLVGAQMQGANLDAARMEAADLTGAQMEGARVNSAQMQRARLNAARMQGAQLNSAQMQGADLYGAQMQGADLSGAQMQGAFLGGAQMSKDTTLTAATLRGAAVRAMDDTTLSQLRPFWDAIFADGTLRDGFTDGETWPDHWANEPLEYNPFFTAISPFHQEWRAFAASLDPPVAIAGD